MRFIDEINVIGQSTWHNNARTPSHTSKTPFAPLKKLYKRWYFWACCIRSWRVSGGDRDGPDDEDEEEEEEGGGGALPSRCISIFKI